VIRSERLINIISIKPWPVKSGFLKSLLP